MFMHISRFFCICLCFFLVSCAQKVSSLKVDVDIPLDEDMGYLLIGVETNASIESVTIYGERSIKLTKEDLRSGTNYFLIDVPAGEYSISNVKLNSWWKMGLKEGYWDFSVRSGSISYVGHLAIESYGFFFLRNQIELSNRSSEALVFMEKDFPNILSKRQVYFDGPGEDPFLERMHTIEVLAE
jgi:hypothetical protein